MKILLISKDAGLIKVITEFTNCNDCQFLFIEENEKPVTVVSNALSSNPNLLIIDDDLLKPNTKCILESFKKVNDKINIIFFTSNDSVVFGREITQIGVNYYHIKPINKIDFEALLKSFIKLNSIHQEEK